MKERSECKRVNFLHLFLLFVISGTEILAALTPMILNATQRAVERFYPIGKCVQI